MAAVKTSKDFLPALESVRGIAAVLVMISHFWHWAMDTAGGGLLQRSASLGVDFFFVLSGYILARNYLTPAGPSVPVGTYLWHRVARIYPLHLFFAAAFATAFLATGKPLGVFSWVRELTLTTSIHSTHILNGVSWSLSAEWISYLAFVSVILAATHRRRMLLSASLVIAAGAFCFVLSGGNITVLSHKWGFLRGLFGFFLGCLAWGFEDWISQRRLLLVISVALQLAYVVLGQGHEHLKMLVVLTFVPLVVHLAHPARQAGWLSLRPVVWVGTVSFSLYMGHILWGEIAEAGLAAVGGLGPHYLELAKSAAAMLGAAGTYYLVEQPSRGWLRQLRARLSQ